MRMRSTRPDMREFEVHRQYIDTDRDKRMAFCRKHSRWGNKSCSCGYHHCRLFSAAVLFLFKDACGTWVFKRSVVSPPHTHTRKSTLTHSHHSLTPHTHSVLTHIHSMCGDCECRVQPGHPLVSATVKEPRLSFLHYLRWDSRSHRPVQVTQVQAWGDVQDVVSKTLSTRKSVLPGYLTSFCRRRDHVTVEKLQKEVLEMGGSHTKAGP